MLELTTLNLLIIAAASSLVLYFVMPFLMLADRSPLVGLLVSVFMPVTGFGIGFPMSLLLRRAVEGRL